MDFELIAQSIPILLKGCVVTLQITAMAVFFGFLIGGVAGVARLCSVKIFRILAKCYVDCIRGTPLLVQIFIVYFAVPALFNVHFDKFAAAVIACSVNSGAYVAEICRAGIQSVDAGQMEAGRSLGLSWWQTMKFVVLPQAFKRIIPPLGNEFIAMLKDSSLVSVIGFQELTRSGQLIIARTYASLEIWTCVAAMYLIMVLIVARFVAVLEKRYKTDGK